MSSHPDNKHFPLQKKNMQGESHFVVKGSAGVISAASGSCSQPGREQQCGHVQTDNSAPWKSEALSINFNETTTVAQQGCQSSVRKFTLAPLFQFIIIWQHTVLETLCKCTFLEYDFGTYRTFQSLRWKIKWMPQSCKVLFHWIIMNQITPLLKTPEWLHASIRTDFKVLS